MEKEIDSLHRSNGRRIARMLENMRAVETITRVEPNMAVYRALLVSVVPSIAPEDEEKQERLKEKLHNAGLRVTELETDSMKWQKQNADLVRRVKDLESQDGNLETQRKCRNCGDAPNVICISSFMRT